MIRCATCECEATTSLNGQPACYWCADRSLDGVPCEKCRPTLPGVAPVQYAMPEVAEVPFSLKAEIAPGPKGKQGGLF